MNGQSCEGCRFGVDVRRETLPDVDPFVIECRRHPPRFFEDDKQVRPKGYWPTVQKSEWCGEWEMLR